MLSPLRLFVAVLISLGRSQLSSDDGRTRCADAVATASTPTTTTAAPATHQQLTVGLLFYDEPGGNLQSEIGFSQSAPAVLLAEERIRAEHLLDDYTFKYVWYFDNCREPAAAGYTTKLIVEDNVDVIIGPSCDNSALISGVVAAFHNTPIFVWGATFSSELGHAERFPTLALSDSNSYSLGIAVCALLNYYNWREIAIIYHFDKVMRRCDFMEEDFEDAVERTSMNLTVLLKKQMDNTEESMKETLRELRHSARIVLICMDSRTDVRRLLNYASELGLADSDEFVFIFQQLYGLGMFWRARVAGEIELINMWEGREAGERTNDMSEGAKRMARRSIVVDRMSITPDERKVFDDLIKKRRGFPPFNCNTRCVGSEDMVGLQAPILHDAFYLYARSVNRTLRKYPAAAIRNGTLLLHRNQQGFIGWSGSVSIDENGTRNPVIQVTTVDRHDRPSTYLIVAVAGDTAKITEVPLNTSEDVWLVKKAGHKIPLARPVCGFTGDHCPPNVALYASVAGTIVAVSVVGAILGVSYAICEKVRERVRRDRENLIDFALLRPLSAARGADSKKSWQSVRNASASAHDVISATDPSCGDGAPLTEPAGHAVFVYNERKVYAKKYALKASVQLTSSEMAYLAKLRRFDDDNVNRFIGICLNGTPSTLTALFIWWYCERGSLEDVVTRETYLSDPFVMLALVQDVANGISAIHNSFLGHHGMLTGRCCLINDRWQVKISGHGVARLLGARLRTTPLPRKALLWTAPEHLRRGDENALIVGSREGDIYSFGIICAELYNHQTVWNGVNDEEEIDVKMLLIQECWQDEPHERPKIGAIRSTLRQITKHGNKNLMDYVFGMLENYANSLEQEVQERTKQLVEERKKSDSLLYRMLPMQVANKLRRGESVEPESYETATIFFSDVVSFTVLASKCTPLQVVNFLNQLYTIFDGLIAQHDAYKVETIGDAYLICSGIPRRNELRHVKEIADLALEIMEALDAFRIPHMPDERIRIRIGIHTGSVVAGVVGLSMPRYCLFGDTVNTASRMESSGKPSMIHISAVTNRLLTNRIGGYVTEPRGKIDVKGKGTMETYWLIGRAGE